MKDEYKSSCGQQGGSQGKFFKISIIKPILSDTGNVFEPQSSLDENLHIAKQEPVRFGKLATHRQ